MTNRGQVVADDRPCLVCGYNLRAIARGGKCPECGTPVERSLQGDLLKYSSPEYVATLRRGITLVELAIGLGILFALGIIVAGVIAAMGNGMFQVGAHGLKPMHGLVFERVMQLLKTAITGLSLLGWWLFSTQDPGLTTQDPAYKSRRFLRLFLAASAVIAMASSILVFVPSLMTQAHRGRERRPGAAGLYHPGGGRIPRRRR